MKTMKTILALVITVLWGFGAMASGNLRVNMSQLNKDLAEVEIFNIKTSTFKIDVKDEYGDVIFYKETKAPSNNYKRNYDFSRLEDGTYFLTVKVDNESTETKFSIERGQMNILDVKKSVEPVFVFDNRKLKMSYLNFEGDKSKVYVYDRNKNLLYEKELNAGFAQHHGLDFSKAQRGSYEVVLASGNNVHTYSVFID